MAGNPTSNYPNGFPNGLTVRGVSVLNSYSGNVFWVDSVAGSDGGHGTYQKPFATLDYAVGRCTANNGDIILLKAGHAETIIADSGVDVDVAGVTVLGLGTGSDRPTFTFGTATTADFKLSAANGSIDNLLFLNDIDQLAMMIETSGKDPSITNCEFREGTAKQALTFITVGVDDADSDRAYIGHCKFYAPTAGDGDAAISIAKDMTGVTIEDCDVYGDFDLACIDIPAGGNAQVDCRIINNRLQNLLSGQHAIQVNGTASTGLIDGNIVITDALSTAIDPGGLTPGQNIWNSAGDNDTSGVDPLSAADAATNFIGADDSDNAASTTNVTANGDGSVLERLEQIQQVTSGGGAASAANTLLGVQVTRAAADIFDGTTTNLFTVSSGNVLLTSIYIEVSGAAVDNTPSNTKLRTNPTTGTDIDLCANLDIDSDEAGTLYSITGTLSDALQGGSGGGAVTMANPIIIPPGTIDLVSSADAGTGGALGAVTLYYIPLETGASVASA